MEVRVVFKGGLRQVGLVKGLDPPGADSHVTLIDHNDVQVFDHGRVSILDAVLQRSVDGVQHLRERGDEAIIKKWLDRFRKKMMRGSRDRCCKLRRIAGEPLPAWLVAVISLRDSREGPSPRSTIAHLTADDVVQFLLVREGTTQSFKSS